MAYLPKIRSPFLILKKVFSTYLTPPPYPLPICASVSVTEYASMYLNIHEYPWKCLNKLFWLCQGSAYAWSSYMFDKILKLLWVLNNQGYWIWDRCVFHHYAKFRMPYFGSIRLNNAYVCLDMFKYPSLCLSMAEYCWTFLNIPENPWINRSDYARILNMSQYSHSNIIIVTNVIMLEFL